MRIQILHLSDMHFVDKKGFNAFQLDKIADALNMAGAVDSLIIIISGDVAHSGTIRQYVTAYCCINRIISTYRKKHHFAGRYEILCVPGNHDVDHSRGCRSSSDLQSIRKTNSYEMHLTGEISKEDQFFNFAKRVKCFSDKGVFCQRIIDFGGYRIEANLINSGVFSIIEEDKGLHYIPQYCINDFGKPSGANMVITVMHHSPEWYTDEQKNLLEAAIYGKSSIVFYGHEHYIGNKTVTHENNPLTLIQAGGELCENDNWTNSTFHVGVFDTDTSIYTQHKTVWNTHQMQYEQTDDTVTELPRKPSVERKISILPEYANKLHLDEKHNISNSFLDYFVFPRIQAEDGNGSASKEYTEMADFILVLKEKRRVLINGGYNSGKTSLLKALFFKLSENLTVIYCDIANFRGKKAVRILKDCFTDIYGENPSDYARFLQIPKEQRAIIIDDIDLIKEESFDCFVEQLSESFEYFILASKQVLDLNLIDRVKVYLRASDTTFRYKILPVYADKRLELIKNVVSIKSEDKPNIEKTTSLLAEAINAQRRFISLDPDFIIKFVEYYCNNIGEAGSDSGVFSKVFEANLTYALNPYQTTRLSVDKLFVILSKIARYSHFNKAYPISERVVFEIIDRYNTDYGANVNCTEAINAMCKAKILICDSGNGYRFTNRNYLAYYVAREVNSQYNVTGDDTDLQTILKYACFGINADILLFISYITDNIRVLRLMLNMTNELTKTWEEFDFESNIPYYLKTEKKHTVVLPEADAREREKAEEIKAERDLTNEIQTVEIYDYSDADADNFVNQIIRACSLLIVVAKCLPNFEHNMLKADKDTFVRTIYELPNRIFGLWANETDKNIDELVRFFREQTQDFYLRHRMLEDDDIVEALQRASISLLLDLYNLSVFYSAKDNTYQYLLSFDRGARETYMLEHLMILERIGSGNSFTESAIKLSNLKKNGTFMMALHSVISHAIIFMKALDYRLIQQLRSQYFSKKASQKMLMSRLMSTDKNIEE